jgi:hypothetical protein
LQVMGIEAIYPKGSTSQPGQGHRIYPYLPEFRVKSIHYINFLASEAWG